MSRTIAEDLHGNLAQVIVVKVREVIRLIEADGWYWVATRGSHRQFKHQSKPGRVTVAGKLSDALAPGTLNSILKQAGLAETRGCDSRS